MAGHSHWAGIKHKKALVDKKRGKIFSKLAKQITIAAKHGGGNPDMNLPLKYAIEKAKAANMPKDGIERAIKKGTGELEGETLYEVVYEGYAPGGVAVMVEVVSDNKNRTVGEVRHVFDKRGGNLGASGCVAWMFDKKGVISVSAENYDEEALLELALEAGAENVEQQGGAFQITTAPEDLIKVTEYFKEKGIHLDSSEIMMIPKNTVPLDAPTGKKVLALLEALENLDDVEKVSANFDIPEEVFKELEAEES